jgi:methionine-rich copper-binding protein CopC
MKLPRTGIPAMLLAAVVIPGTAWAHATLQTARPAKDDVVAAPAEITLQFNEKLEGAFSSARVVDSAGKEVRTDKAVLDPGNPAVLKLAVPALAAGKYRVEYAVVGHDGHRRKGDYAFTVK